MAPVESLETRIEHVTLYARGARVRRVTTNAAALPGRVRIVGLPLAIVDDTVRVEVDGPAIATSVRAGIDVPAGEPAPEDLPELRGAKRRTALAQAEVDRIEAALARLSAASSIAEDPSDEPPAAWAAIVTARRAVVALRAEREHALAIADAAARRELEDAERALEAAADRDRRAGSARPAKPHEPRKHVEVELVGTGPVTLRLEYLVAAARWAPSYVARLDGEHAGVELRAVVAQDTGEDWIGVPLALSTAEPTRFAQLPELAAQRIGRRQDEPARTGFRPPPVGAAALYADYDRELLPRMREARQAPKSGSFVAKPELNEAGRRDDDDAYRGLAQEVWDEESSAAKQAFSTPARGVPMPVPPPQAVAPAGAVMRLRRAESEAPMAGAIASDDMKKRAIRAAADDAQTRLPEPPPPPAPAAALLDYANLVMAAPASPSRGRLVPAAGDGHRHAIDQAVETGRARVIALPLPPGCIGEWSHTYDYAFATDGNVDVKADGAWHSIAVTSQAATVKLHHVAVPREQADVFRLAAIANPFAGPLLPGPIDVYDRGRFLVTSSVDYTPPAAPVEIGLGVDAAVKIARNTEFREEATGMLRGALVLHHAIAIDIENVSGRAVELEVRERVPVTREGDDDIELKLGKVEPAWDRWTPETEGPRDRRLRGGYRWRVSVPAGGKRTLRAAYEVKIPGKTELVGGNRREA